MHYRKIYPNKKVYSALPNKKGYSVLPEGLSEKEGLQCTAGRSLRIRRVTVYCRKISPNKKGYSVLPEDLSE